MNINKKLTFEDIEILSANKQVRRAINDKYGSIIKFADEIQLYESTIEKYLSSKSAHTDNFKAKLTKALNEGYYDIVLTKRQQINNMVISIYKNISLYSEIDDIITLEKLLKISMDNDWTIESFMMHRNIGQYYFNLTKIDSSIEHYKLAYNVLDNIKDNELKVDCLLGLGLLYIYDKSYSAAKGIFRDIESIIDNSEDRATIDNYLLYLYYYRFGILLNYTNRYANAKEMFEVACTYADTDRLAGKAIMNIGIIKKKQKQYDLAIKFYNEALSKFEKNEDIAIVYNNIAEVYRLNKDIDSALHFIEKAIILIPENDYANQFIFHQTLIEIKAELENINQSVSKLFDILEKCIDSGSKVYKRFLSDSMKAIIDIIANAKEYELMKEIESRVLYLIKQNKIDNQIYTNELLVCYGIIKYHQATTFII